MTLEHARVEAAKKCGMRFTPRGAIAPADDVVNVVENDEGTLRLAVDGQTVFEHKETASIMGDEFDRVGFCFIADTRVESVRVFVKRLDDGYL